jgi:hypothetical protein
MKSFVVSFVVGLFFSCSVWANLQLPRNLTTADERRLTEILGYSTAGKILGDPYPLGGYAGIELGYAYEVIETGELARLGDKTSKSQSETNCSLMTLGKGLYENVDIFVQFTPFSQTEGISDFGGQVRWGFYQAEYLPAHLSLIGSLNTTNFQNKITTLSETTDLVVGFSAGDVTLYTGMGIVRSIGTFVGGVDGVTADGQTSKADVAMTHYLAGVDLKFSKTFLAMQIDRFTESTYSAKLGVRF